MGKNKEKVTYIDDGRPLADMSAVGRSSRLNDRNPYRPAPKFKDVWKTYWSAVKMMIKPMLVVIAGIGLIYVIMYVLFGLM